MGWRMIFVTTFAIMVVVLIFASKLPNPYFQLLFDDGNVKMISRKDVKTDGEYKSTEGLCVASRKQIRRKRELNKKLNDFLDVQEGIINDYLFKIIRGCD